MVDETTGIVTNLVKVSAREVEEVGAIPMVDFPEVEEVVSEVIY